MKRLIVLSMLFIFAVTLSYATESTTAEGTAKAKIVAAASITHPQGAALDFGAVFRNASGGSVTLTAAASPQRTLSNVTAAAGSFTADHFQMSDLDVGTTYSLSVPASFDITRSGGSETMSVAPALSESSFQATAATKEIYVGGVLTVGANQVAGEYSGNYTVTVTY